MLQLGVLGGGAEAGLGMGEETGVGSQRPGFWFSVMCGLGQGQSFSLSHP